MNKKLIKKRKQKQIAKTRINKLLNICYENIKKKPDYCSKYIKLILIIKRKNKIKLNPIQKYQICKKCNTYLKPGITSKIRIKNKLIKIECLNCNKRYIINSKKQSNK